MVSRRLDVVETHWDDLVAFAGILVADVVRFVAQDVGFPARVPSSVGRTLPGPTNNVEQDSAYIRETLFLRTCIIAMGCRR